MQLITVIDGDTFMVVDKSGTKRKLRLLDVDCPELNQRNGKEAKAYVAKMCLKRYVSVRLTGRDRYRRHLANVRVGGQDLAYLLVQQGLAYSIGGSWRLRLAGMGARMTGKGVHRGFGQSKPWEASTRKNGFSRWLYYRLRNKR
jgi:micrococcal nuclease